MIEDKIEMRDFAFLSRACVLPAVLAYNSVGSQYKTK